MTFGEFLQQKRIALGYTQSYVAEKLGVTNRTVSRYEHNVILPQQPILKDYRRILSATIEDFYTAYENHGRNDSTAS